MVCGKVDDKISTNTRPQAANHLASANQVTSKILARSLATLFGPPAEAYQQSKTPKQNLQNMSWPTFIDNSFSCNQIKQITFAWLRLRWSFVSPVSTVLHGVLVKSLQTCYNGRWGLDLGMEPSHENQHWLLGCAWYSTFWLTGVLFLSLNRQEQFAECFSFLSRHLQSVSDFQSRRLQNFSFP